MATPAGEWARARHTCGDARALSAARRMVVEPYLGLLLPQQPISHITPAQCERNEEIRHRHGRGESWASLAEVFGISEQRVSQIVQGKRR